jgi:hypothetical protein
MKSTAIALAFVFGMSASLPLAPIEIKGNDGPHIEARVIIRTSPGKSFLIEGKATQGVFELDEKSLADQIKKKEKVVVQVIPPNQKEYEPYEDEYDAIDVARKKFTILLRKRMFP